MNRLEPPLLPMLPEDWDIREHEGTYHLYYDEKLIAQLAAAHETVVSLNWARNVLHHLKNLSMEGYPNVDHDIDYLQSILDKRNTQC